MDFYQKSYREAAIKNASKERRRVRYASSTSLVLEKSTDGCDGHRTKLCSVVAATYH